MIQLAGLPQWRRQTIPRSAAGLALVELMIVVAIISILMAIAVPSYQLVQRRARAGALVNDFRVFSAVFLTYAHENGAWPPEAPPGVVPVGITRQDLQIDRWTGPTPIGGHFDWENMQVHPGGTSPGGTWHAAIAITDTPDAPLVVDLDLYQQIDELLDDGNLHTGSFRLGDNNCPIYILDP